MPTKRHCPICNTQRENKFSSFGINLREDAKCDSCGSLERHRLIWLYIKKYTDLLNTKDKKMLHIAPERIFQYLFSQYLKKNYLSADLHNPRAMIKMDITDIQFPNESFNYIYCSHVLEHVIDDRKAMRELLRVLKNDGWAILLVPIQTNGKTFEDFSIVTKEERLKTYGHPEHVRNYGRDYTDRLTESGFNVQIIAPNDFLSDSDIKLYGLTPAAGEIYLCTKNIKEF